MIKFKIRNFRSIRKAELNLTPLTILYGPNGAGKSSLLYSLMVLKKIALNPAQSMENFFNLGFLNMGGFEQVVFDHKENNSIDLTVETDEKVVYGVSLNPHKSFFRILLPNCKEERLLVSFPYPTNKKARISVGNDIIIYWNGVTAYSVECSENNLDKANSWMTLINSPVELLRQVEMVSLRRGFTKPIYNPVNLTSMMSSEDEIATLLESNRYLENKVKSYSGDIFGKYFSVRPQRGVALFYLQMVDEMGLTSELINEGFGLNQTIFMLAKLLKHDTKILLVEEPEIHLHPTAQRKLVHAFIRAIKEEGKHIVISTHSEHILLSVLSSVAGGKISPEEVSCYLVKKKRKESVIQQQKVNEKGQIENGLSSFLEGELEDIKTLLGG